MATEPWWLYRTEPLDAARNMALDEALLLHAHSLGQPTLRFYSWRQPAATFGYFQPYADVASWTHLRPLIRRCSAGGLVPHDGDWTYSLVFPPNHAWTQLRAPVSYQRIHDLINQTFHRLGFQTTLAPIPDPTGPGQCFLGAEVDDVLWNERKIAGAAQRRNKNGLLIQGSIQPPPHLSRAVFEDQWLRVLENAGIQTTPLPELLAAPLLETAASLEISRYSNPAFLQSR